LFGLLDSFQRSLRPIDPILSLCCVITGFASLSLGSGVVLGAGLGTHAHPQWKQPGREPAIEGFAALLAELMSLSAVLAGRYSASNYQLMVVFVSSSRRGHYFLCLILKFYAGVAMISSLKFGIESTRTKSRV